MGWRRRTYVGEKTATSIHTDDDDDDEDDASWAQTLIDSLLVDTAGDKENWRHTCIKVSVSWKCESFGGTALVLNRTNRSVYH